MGKVKKAREKKLGVAAMRMIFLLALMSGGQHHCIFTMLTTTEMRCLRKAAEKTRMDKVRNEEIRWRVNMPPAEQTANKDKIRWWSHVKMMAPTAPQIKALVIQPEGRRPRGWLRNRWEDDVPRWYKEMGIPITDVNNWVKERCQLPPTFLHFLGYFSNLRCPSNSYISNSVQLADSTHLTYFTLVELFCHRRRGK